MKRNLLLLLCYSAFLSAFAQEEIPVDMFTGKPSVYIPIWTLRGHDLQESVGISYNASGVRLKETNGLLGVGWSLNAGGSVTREVRGLPDDFAGTGSDTRKGWLYSTIASSVGNIPMADVSESTCSDEVAANTILLSYNYTTDTEPDIYYYSAGGINGAFVFDNNLNIRLIPYRDVKIEYATVSSTDKTILSFTITDNAGVIYKFDVRTSSTRHTTKASGITSVEFQKREFSYYDKSRFGVRVTHTTSWVLSETKSPSGATLTYSYTTKPATVTRDTIRVGIRQSTVSKVVAKNIYISIDSTETKHLSSILSSSGESVGFSISDDNITEVNIGDNKLGISFVKKFTFEYEEFYPLSVNKTRTFLKSIKEVSGCDEKPPYQFTYIGVDFVNNTCALPSIYSTGKDFWGYFNGKVTNANHFPNLYVYPSLDLSERYRLYPIPGYAGSSYTLAGSDRTPDAASMQIGSLETIQYPSGGSSTFNYEPHEYYDAVSGQNYIGGGLRISSILYFDGVKQNNIVKNFVYKETNGTTSSGRLLSRPSFAIPMKEYRDPFTNAVKTYTTLSGGTAQDLWEHLTARSEIDLSQSFDGTIGYGRVKVLRSASPGSSGAGSAEFEFDLSASFGSGPLELWSATQFNFIRPFNFPCISMGIVTTGGEWGFPYGPNPNFDYARGFLLRKVERDENGVKVRETVNTPQYIYKSGSTPVKVFGVQYDNYPNGGSILFAGKYFLLTDVEKTVDQETVTIYDVNDANKNITSVTKYYFDSPAHRLLTRTQHTTAEGTIVSSRVKYPLDYTLTGTQDLRLKAIGVLQSTFRNGIPIEKIVTQTKPGQSAKVIQASISTFSDFGQPGKAFIYQQLELKAGDGLTNFSESTPYLESGVYKFKFDTRYDTLSTILDIDSYQRPLSIVGKDKIITSSHWGHKKSLPVVTAVGASYNEFVFSNFETDNPNHTTGNEFTLTASIYGDGRTGLRGLHPVVKLSKTLKKANTNNYKLSFWLKKSSAPVEFRVILKNQGGPIVYYNQLFTVSPTTSDFEYFEKLIPVTSVSSNNFIIELQGQFPAGTDPVSSPTLLPLIDDVAFYPEKALLTSYTYDFPFGVNSITDASNQTGYIMYDNLGRKRLIFDHDHNIIQKFTYKYDAIPSVVLSATINGPSTVTANSERSFSASVNCVDGVTFEWDTGNGFTKGSGSIVHSFSTVGTFTISLRVSHPLYATVTYTKQVVVTQPPPPPTPSTPTTICAKGTQWYSVSAESATKFYSCSSITSNPSDDEHTLFKVDQVSFSNPIQLYEWSVHDGSSQGWTVVSNAAEFNMNIINDGVLNGEITVYFIRCDVTSTTGVKASSNVMRITMYP